MNRRFVEIDALKATAITTVILIHGLRPTWDFTISPIEAWLGYVTRFAVPGFLLASGFLYATHGGVAPALTRRRLRRLLVPYLIASLCAQAWAAWLGRPLSAANLAFELFFGVSFGPYYYVFVIALLMLATPLFSRLSPLHLKRLTLALLAAQGVLVISDFGIPFVWHVRNPILWWAFYLVGWQLRSHYDGVLAWIAVRRGELAGWLTAIVAMLSAACATDLPLIVIRAITWIDSYAILALIFILSCGRRHSPAPLRALSDATYAIYLFHLFFLYAARPYFPFGVRSADFASLFGPWLAGLVGSIALVALARLALGARSRDVIGA